MSERRCYSTPGFPSAFRLRDLGPQVHRETVDLFAEDGLYSHRALYWKGDRLPKTVVLLMHPRMDHTRNYTIPFLVEAGFAAFGIAGRWVNNDVAMIHEVLLLDIAAGR